jgi:hypothetical protein
MKTRERLAKLQSEFKYLVIKDWDKHQPSGKLFKKGARLPWIKDYTDKLENYEYLQLTLFQRAVYEGCCLLVGKRPDRSLPNDTAWIARALHASRPETPCVPSALIVLIDRGLLIPTNDEDFFKLRAEKGSGELREESGRPSGSLEMEAKSREGRDDDVDGDVKQPENSDQEVGPFEQEPEAKPTPEPEQPADPVRSLVNHFFILLGEPERHRPKVEPWAALVAKLSSDHDRIREVMGWALESSEVWSRAITTVQRVDPMEYFCEKFETIAAGMEGDRKFAENREKRLKQIASQTKKAMAQGAANADKPQYRQVPGDKIVDQTKVMKI